MVTTRAKIRWMKLRECSGMLQGKGSPTEDKGKILESILRSFWKRLELIGRLLG